MKLKHLFFNALAVISFAACSSEAEEIKPADKSTTATLQLDMTGQYGSGNSDQTRALSLDGTEYPRFIHEEGVTDWSTHCFIRNEAGTVQFYALVDWNATTDSDGNISLHIKNSTLTLQNSAGSDVTATETLPKAGERWYIAGIAGGGVLDATKSNVDFAYSYDLDKLLLNNQARIPLSFGWTRFTVPSNSERAPRIVVQFQPQGTLLSVNVNNKTNVNNEALEATFIKVRSNALSQDGVFDYSLTASRADYTAAPKWTFTSDEATTSDIYQTIEGMASNASFNQYVWAMPRPESAKPSGGFSTRIGLVSYKVYEAGTTNTPVARTTSYKAGLSYSTSIDVNRPFLPYEYFTTHNVATDGVSFTSSQANDASGLWNWADAVDKFKAITIDGRDYRLPVVNEMRSIFPQVSLTNLNFSSESTVENITENIRLDAMTKGTLSSYKSSGSNIIYALRYREKVIGTETEYKNHRLTAVRYEYTDNSNGGKMLRTTFRHLGTAGAATTLARVADETYWQSNTENDVVLEFPASRRLDASGQVMNTGSGWYWTRSERSTGSVQAWVSLFQAGGVFGLQYSDKTPQCAVRLYKSDIF